MLHEGSPQVNGVFEFVCHKQSFDKEVFHKELVAKKYNAWSNQTKFKTENLEHESDLAG